MPFSNFYFYPNKYFIETGSYYGNGIQAALDSGFENIISIEITDGYFKYCVTRFKNNKEVQVILGDSVEELPKILSNIDLPVTFYLDGHWDFDDGETRGKFDFPVYKELEIIKEHHIKTHTIIIDDVRLFDTFWNLDSSVIIDMLKEINPNYKIEFYDGYVAKDVLVAHL